MTILLAALLVAEAAARPEPGPVAPAPVQRLPAAPMARAEPAPAHPTPRAKPARAQILAAVRAEWPRYDVRRTGRLGPLEFATWVMRANGAKVAAAGAAQSGGIRPVPAMNAAARAFAVADANHDGGVTPEEMADFLAR
ncbi:hypothetical protein [Sphingomonas morindae]|uniref:EF-hand domain-containing protein n=1 Tax=Sphingomonas morindae TaxID=1541170 RepID=A0ABY4XA40_9SPHN|nr:hypothetical protein [Sphingomonas morindae]USI73832.1 hypothetical protein LHA26_05025 [Sphingomonas morindae]